MADGSINSTGWVYFCNATLEAEGITCQEQVCLIPSPAHFDTSYLPHKFGIPIMFSMLLFVAIGFISLIKIKGNAYNFFVCGRSLNLFYIASMLSAQSLDSNATLGNVTLAYKFHFWDGAVLPIGLGLSLILNGIFLAKKLNKMQLLTLPDAYGRTYGIIAEILVTILTCISFTFLIAGNLVGLARILDFVFGDLGRTGGCAIGALLVVIYTGAGGLFSAAWTDVVMCSQAWIGILVTTIYVLAKYPNYPNPSNGFPGFEACGTRTAEEIAALDPSRYDNGGYPVGDKPLFWNGMFDRDAYAPFPNAILFNWATIFVLGLGNLCALDFQARSFASKTPEVARAGNIIAGVVTILVGVPMSFIGGVVRYYYGPDSKYAVFNADTSSLDLDLPSCAEWVPDQNAYLKLMAEQYPKVLGVWSMICIISASMSTLNGAILAVSTVISNNLVRRFCVMSLDRLLLVARCLTVPVAVIASVIALKNDDPGYLLVVAFDIVFAGCLVPLFGAIHFRDKVTPNAGVLTILSGSILRIILEFTLPKDGSFVAFGKHANTYDTAKEGAPCDWDASKPLVHQGRLSDWTGLDSLVSPAFSLLVMVVVSWIERTFHVNLLFFIPQWLLSPFISDAASLKNLHEGSIHGIKSQIETRQASLNSSRCSHIEFGDKPAAETLALDDSHMGGKGAEEGKEAMAKGSPPRVAEAQTHVLADDSDAVKVSAVDAVV
eukprot:jgi/Mesvir1/1874/Mv22909-RA.1